MGLELVLQAVIKFLLFAAMAVAGVFAGKKLREYKTAKDGK